MEATSELVVDLDDIVEGEEEDGIEEEEEEEEEELEEEAEAEEPELPGFDLGRFRYDGPWPEEIPDPSDCTVYNGGGATVKELLTGNTKPVLAIRGDVWDEVQHLVHLTPKSEMAMFLVLKQFDSGIPKYLAVDLFFPKQEAGGTGVSIDVPSADRFYSDLNAHQDYREHMHGRLCHLHSHAGMACFWSAADTNQQLSRDDLGYYDDFRFYVVVNTRNELRCSFVQYKPFLRRFDNVPVVVIGKPALISDERKAELGSWVKERVSKMVGSGTVFDNLKTFGDDVTEAYGEAPAKTAYGRGRAGSFKPLRSVERRAGNGCRWEWEKPVYDVFDYDLDYHYTGGLGCLDGCEIGGSAYREEFAGSGIAGEFVEYCLNASSRRTWATDEEVDDFVECLYADGAAGGRLAGLLRRMSRMDRHDAALGFAELVGGKKESMETLAYLMSKWLRWLDMNEKNLDAMAPFLKARA